MLFRSIPFESAARQNKEINEELIEINELSYLEINDVNGFVFDNNNNKSITNLGKKPNDYSEFNWQTKQWDTLADWLDKAKADAVKQINQAASQKILSKYPIYKQLNLARTDEAQVMYDWIDNIRNLSNIANANIETSTTLEQINSIVDNFKTEVGNIA